MLEARKDVIDFEPDGQVVDFRPRDRKILEIVFKAKKNKIDTDKLIRHLLSKIVIHSLNDKGRLKNIYNRFF